MNDDGMKQALESFRASLSGEAPPAEWPASIQALWHLERGDWSRAHEIAQEEETAAGAWIHAHLHRIEGDDWNARYWYRQAGRPEGRGDFAAERADILQQLLRSDAVR